MKIIKLIPFSIALLLLVTNVYGQQKRAQTSMKFLSVSPDARASGMGDAVTSLDMGANAAFYNPASMANIEGKYAVTGGVVQWITDINYNSASFVYKPADGKFGVFGINALSVDYGSILATVVDENSASGYSDVGTISPGGYAFGFSYANSVTEQFSIGANFRYANLDLGSAYVDVTSTGYETESFSAGTGVLDFGILYKTGFESLNFAMALRNFSTGVTFAEEETELPLTFKIGLSMNVLDLTNVDSDTHALLISVDANRPRDYDEQLLFGAEYSFIDRFMLRGGYGFPKDEEQYSIGGGIKQPLGSLTLIVNYAYTKFGVFGEVNRFGIQLGF